MTNDEKAREVLAHSEDEGEWEDEAIEIEARPSGSQVVSFRLPTEVAQRLYTASADLGVRPSELVRAVVERALGSGDSFAVLRAGGGAPGWPVRIFTPTYEYRAENSNLVIEGPIAIVSLGFEEAV